MSALSRDLIREALELCEDVALAAVAEERDRTFDRKKAVFHIFHIGYILSTISECSMLFFAYRAR
jgi:hypothetical protein